MPACPRCGVAAPPDARFCSGCGAPLAGEPDAASEEVLFEGSPATIPGAGALLLALLTIGIAALYFWVRSMARRYKVTTKRIVVEEGLLSKRTESVELYRATDFVVEKPFGQRLLGTGNLTVITTDPTAPEVRIEHVRTDVSTLYERLRAAAERERRRRGHRVIDVE